MHFTGTHLGLCVLPGSYEKLGVLRVYHYFYEDFKTEMYITIIFTTSVMVNVNLPQMGSII